LYWFPDEIFVLDCVEIQAVRDWPSGKEDYVDVRSVKQLTREEAIAWLCTHDKYPPLEEWPADFYAVVEECQVSAPESAPSRPAEGESEQTQPEGTATVAPTKKADGRKPTRKKRWTREKANEAINKFFLVTKAQEYADFLKLREDWEPDVTTLTETIQEVFGRNAVAKALGMSAGLVSQSVWLEFAARLGIPHKASQT
jgi:hypothetical protein